MKITRRSLLALLAFLPHRAPATYQDGDILAFRGDILQIPVFPLEDCPFFDKTRRFSPRPGVDFTNRSRGYIASWEIDDDTLWLIDIAGVRFTPGMGWETPSLDDLFPGRLEIGRLRASWFTGLLLYPGVRWGGPGSMPGTYELPLLLEKASLVIHIREGCVTRVDDSRGLPSSSAHASPAR